MIYDAYANFFSIKTEIKTKKKFHNFLKTKKMKSFLLLLLLILFTSTTLAGKAVRNYGNGRRNDRNFKSDFNVNNANSIVERCRVNTTGINVGPVTVDKDGYGYVCNTDGFLRKFDLTTCQVIWATALSDAGGRVVVDPFAIFAPQDWCRHAPAQSKNGALISVGNTGPGNLRQFTYASADGSLVSTTLIDPHPAAVVTSSIEFLDSPGQRHIIVVKSSSREEVFAADPNYQLTFRAGVYFINAYTGEVVGDVRMAPVNFTGNAIVGGGSAYLKKQDLMFVTTGNNYNVSEEAFNCIQENQNNGTGCYNDQVNMVDSVVAINTKTYQRVWSRSTPGPRGYDVWTFRVPNPEFDQGFIAGPILKRITIKVMVDGKLRSRRIWAIEAADKRGFVYTYNAITGEPVFEIYTGAGSANAGGHFGGGAADRKGLTCWGNNNGGTDEVTLQYEDPVTMELVNGQVTNQSFVTCIDNREKEIQYQFVTPGGGPCYAGPVITNDMGCCGLRNSVSGPTVACFDLEDGDIVYEKDLGGLSGNPVTFAYDKYGDSVMIVPQSYVFEFTRLDNSIVILENSNPYDDEEEEDEDDD